MNQKVQKEKRNEMYRQNGQWWLEQKEEKQRSRKWTMTQWVENELEGPKE